MQNVCRHDKLFNFIYYQTKSREYIFDIFCLIVFSINLTKMFSAKELRGYISFYFNSTRYFKWLKAEIFFNMSFEPYIWNEMLVIMLISLKLKL